MRWVQFVVNISQKSSLRLRLTCKSDSVLGHEGCLSGSEFPPPPRNSKTPTTETVQYWLADRRPWEHC